MTHFRNAKRLLALAGAAAFLAATLVTPLPAFAQGNLVRIEPSGIEVAPGGSFTIALIDEPPPESTAVWAIDISYDPNVIAVPDPDHDCDSLDPPPGSTSASICQGADSNSDGTTDTIKVLGFVLYNGTGTGLTEETVLAQITFSVVGGPGECSDLHLRVRSHADSDGNETGAGVQDGRVCIAGDAPSAGTASAAPFTPRTSEPTESPSPRPSASTGGPQNSGTGQTGGSDGGGGGSSGVANGSETGSAVADPDSAGPDGGSPTSANDEGGWSPPASIAGLVALLAVLAAGGAWWLIRLRGAKRPADEGDSS